MNLLCLIIYILFFFIENRPLPQPVDNPVSIVPFILMLNMFRIKTMELYYLYLHWIFQIAYHMFFFCEFQPIYIMQIIFIWLKKLHWKLLHWFKWILEPNFASMVFWRSSKKSSFCYNMETKHGCPFYF